MNGLPSCGLGLGLALWLGCAADPARPQSFRAIQTQEATISHAERRLAAGSGCAEEQALAVEDVCRASRAICEQTQGQADRDAQGRCLRGADRCGAAREQWRATCATQAR